jgi:large subunit ribosomal protein L6
MSRIGRLPIPLEGGVKVSIQKDRVLVEGPKGKLTQVLPRGISVEEQDKELVVKRSDDTKKQRALHGLSRALLANAAHGVKSGFTKQLEIHGVGYGAEVKGKAVGFKLGYSHPISFPVPPGIEIKVERNVVTVTGADRQQVGQVAAEIRALRPPDVYKQKGIRYVGERLRKKAGKTGGA